MRSSKLDTFATVATDRALKNASPYKRTVGELDDASSSRLDRDWVVVWFAPVEAGKVSVDIEMDVKLSSGLYGHAHSWFASRIG